MCGCWGWEGEGNEKQYNKSQDFWYLQSENNLHSLSLWPQNCTCQLRADPAERTEIARVTCCKTTQVNHTIIAKDSIRSLAIVIIIK